MVKRNVETVQISTPLSFYGHSGQAFFCTAEHKALETLVLAAKPRFGGPHAVSQVAQCCSDPLDSPLWLELLWGGVTHNGK